MSASLTVSICIIVPTPKIIIMFVTLLILLFLNVLIVIL